MNVIVNGKATDVPDDSTVADAITVSGHRGGTFGVAVALNGEVVPRAAWASTKLTRGDRVEVLVAAQGG
ncbi:MAG TPA: sulfur carrier protein ThiS [Actinomycetota bacterium]|nr:sulfur carrier protein ThiS [Actinomycetota bacterium]